MMLVFEAIEGPFRPSSCLLARPACNGAECLLGGMLSQLNSTFANYFRQHTLADLAPGSWLKTLKNLPKGKAPTTPSVDL
jgi:DNA-binding IscR family transcriptional regulator